MELKEKVISVGNNMFKRAVVEEPQITKGKKGLARLKIHRSVFDLYDSVADNAKAISLLFSLLSRIYEALPEEVKANISENDRAVIEYAFKIFKNVRTRADMQFEQEGLKLIDKLMDRQKRIAEIIEVTYK